MKYIKKYKLFETLTYETELKKYGLELITNDNGDIIVKDGKTVSSTVNKSISIILKLYECGFRMINGNVFKNNKFSFENKSLFCFVLDEDTYFIGTKFIPNMKSINTNTLLIYLDKLKDVSVKDYVGLSNMNLNYVDYLTDKYGFNINNEDDLYTFKYKEWKIEIKHIIDTEKNIFYIKNIFDNLKNTIIFDLFIGLEKKEFDNKIIIFLDNIIQFYKTEISTTTYGGHNQIQQQKNYIKKQIDAIIADYGFFNRLSFEFKKYIIDLLIKQDKHEEFVLTQLIKDDNLFNLVKNELLNKSKYEEFIVDKLIKDDKLFHQIKDKLNNKIMNKYIEMINNNDSLI